MTILSDKSIAKLASSHGMVEPFIDHQIRNNENGAKIISYGNSSYGYDARVSNEFKILEALNFLRIYPYAREEKDLLIIENILKKLPIYEEFNNPNGR